jgi:hypothetical protein
MKPAETWERIVAGSRDIRFRDFEGLLRAFGFEIDPVRQPPDLPAPQITRLHDVQPEGGKAEPYQFRQLLGDVRPQTSGMSDGKVSHQHLLVERPPARPIPKRRYRPAIYAAGRPAA